MPDNVTPLYSNLLPMEYIPLHVVTTVRGDTNSVEVRTVMASLQIQGSEEAGFQVLFEFGEDIDLVSDSTTEMGIIYTGNQTYLPQYIAE